MWGVIRSRQGPSGLPALEDEPLIWRSAQITTLKWSSLIQLARGIEHATIEGSQVNHGDRPMSTESGTEGTSRHTSPGPGKVFETEPATTGSGGQQRKRRT